MTKKELLESTVEYYSADVNRRCVDDLGQCFYNPAQAGKAGISDGCAIGRFMTEKQQNLAEGHRVESLLDLPVSLQGIEKEFLSDIQYLHDLHACWTETGLSVGGQSTVFGLKQKYNIK